MEVKRYYQEIGEATKVALSRWKQLSSKREVYIYLSDYGLYVKSRVHNVASNVLVGRITVRGKIQEV